MKLDEENRELLVDCLHRTIDEFMPRCERIIRKKFCRLRVVDTKNPALILMWIRVEPIVDVTRIRRGFGLFKDIDDYSKAVSYDRCVATMEVPGLGRESTDPGEISDVISQLETLFKSMLIGDSKYQRSRHFTFYAGYLEPLLRGEYSIKRRKLKPSDYWLFTPRVWPRNI